MVDAPAKMGLDAPTVERLTAPAGGGAFETDAVTLGVFLSDQPGHRIALGGDRPEARPLAKGEGWILPPGAQGFCGVESDLTFLRATVPTRLLADMGLTRPEALAPSVGALDPLTRHLVETLSAAPADAPRLYRDSLAQALAAQLVQTFAPPPPVARSLDDRRLRRALDLIVADPAAELPLARLAAEAAMSPFHFARAFKAATGVSPGRYVLDARLDRAAALLRQSRAPIVDVAQQSGYGDAARFAKHFKRRFGRTPGAYRG